MMATGREMLPMGRRIGMGIECPGQVVYLFPWFWWSAPSPTPSESVNNTDPLRNRLWGTSSVKGLSGPPP